MGVKIYNVRGITSGIRISKRLTAQNDLPEAPSYENPTWVSSGDLGTYAFDEEVAITLEYSDPSNVLQHFSISGTLPSGLNFNSIGGTISGFIEDTASATYNFSVSMIAIYGDIITEDFTISSLVTESEIVWNAESDLGTYDSGQSVNEEIEASIVETTV